MWEKLSGLPALVALGDYRPTDAAEAVFVDLTSRLDAQVQAFDARVASDVPALNAQMAKAGLGAVLP